MRYYTWSYKFDFRAGAVNARRSTALTLTVIVVIDLLYYSNTHNQIEKHCKTLKQYEVMIIINKVKTVAHKKIQHLVTNISVPKRAH